MKKVAFKKRSNILAFASLCIAVALTCSISSAKYAIRHEYTLKLAMAEHFTFAAGNQHIFEIPYDGYYALRLWGGDGGNSSYSWWNEEETYPYGGEGGVVEAVSYFDKGTNLVIIVGTKGDATAGGFNGGGEGGSYYVPLFGNYYGGGGGGATDVRLSSGTLDDRILVAGGGGGGSGGDPVYAPAFGGDGGAKAGNYAGTNGHGVGYGQGGGLSIGGEGDQRGTLGYGGDGGYSGGGGGGGYYGGGGAYGSRGGGGGGSAYVSDVFTIGVPQGIPGQKDYVTDLRDGYAIITFLGGRYMTVDTNGKVASLRYDVGDASLVPEEPVLDIIIPLPEPLPEPEPDIDVTPDSEFESDLCPEDETPEGEENQPFEPSQGHK